MVIFLKGSKHCIVSRENQLKGSIIVQLNSCLFCLNSAALLMFNDQQFYLFSQFQTSKTGGQPYNDTSPYGECSLL